MKNSRLNSSSQCDMADVSQLIDKVLYKLHPEIESNRVNVETDVSELVAPIDAGTIEAAIKNLIQHALNILPQGGEISVTLIDGNYQWELEVADSSTTFTSSTSFSPLASNPNELPSVVPQVIDQYLVDAHRLALRHGGQIQSWDCPQGGMANVLVIPKRNVATSDTVRRVA